MICGSCSLAFTAERLAKDPNETSKSRAFHREFSLNKHLFCQGNCDCLHQGFIEITGKPVKPLFHGGRGGLTIGDVIRPPSRTGYLRPQVCMEQVGLKEHNQDWLTFKKTYRSDRVYCTTALNLARDHAAGWVNWAAVTNAGKAHAPQGAVYRVEPIGILAHDLGVADEHCCKRVHDLFNWCAYSADNLMVAEVIEASVKAVDNQIILSRLEHAYSLWVKRNRGDWYV